MRNILVTNALPYANGHLHLGHMLGYVQSDIWVRFQRMSGHKCYFFCGSDTHGTPIMLKARQQNVKPETLVRKMTISHLADFFDFEVQFDNYHSTHHPLNRKIVEEIYLKLQKSGLIESKEILQAYDQTAQMFLPDRFIKGHCPKCNAADQYGDSCELCSATYLPTDLIKSKSVLSGNSPIQKKTEHLFFKLSALSDSLKAWIENNKMLQPEVVNKLREWFDYGLKDWDISRDAPYFGFEIPNVNSQKYFYVWLDAPIGYIASFKDLCNKSGLKFDNYWCPHSTAELYHFVGKDIIYFHALFWPAILQVANYRIPTSIFANGFLTVNGQKMSKSRGTFILARNYLNKLPSNCLRYYFATKLTPGIEDIDLNLNDFVQKFNVDIVGKVVNIASRCAGFINKNFEGTLSSDILDTSILKFFQEAHSIITEYFEKRDFSKVTRIIMNLADEANKFINTYQPWQLIKQPWQAKKVHDVCSLAINLFKIIMGYLKPIMPTLVLKAENFLNTTYLSWEDIPRLLKNHKINKFKPLISRIDKEKVTEMISEGQ